MLDHLEAEKIVKDCIRSVSGLGGGVDSSKKLKQVGVQTPDMVRDLRDTIATDGGIGVPSVRNHRIALSALGMSTETKVLQVQNMVLFNAKSPSERESLLARVAFEVTLPRGARPESARGEGASRADLVGSFVATDDDDSEESPRANASAKRGAKKGGRK